MEYMSTAINNMAKIYGGTMEVVGKILFIYYLLNKIKIKLTIIKQ
jgi:hypothetical protein